MKKSLIFYAILIYLIFISSCSKLRDDFPQEVPQNVSSSHPEGWNDNTSTNFHGNYFKTNNWDLVECRSCHGTDYAGGSSGISCNNEGCHSETPENCLTCHGGVDNLSGAPPKDLNNNLDIQSRGVGAHSAHLTSEMRFRFSLDCSDCHLTPAKYESAGHVDTELPAEITWGDFARLQNLSPQWDGNSCKNVYCHGNSLSGGLTTEPVWTSDQSIECYFCHGSPPNTGGHILHVDQKQYDCLSCHDKYEKDSTVDLLVHINGNIDVQFNSSIGGSYANGQCSNVSCHGTGSTVSWTGNSELGCTGCHGGSDNETGAPPKDTRGNTERSFEGVGAHTAHVSNPKWNRILDCTECHIKPTQTNDAGHIDSDLPAELTWGTLAKTNEQNPDWNGTTCSGVYCHGSNLKDGTMRSPSWTFDGTLSCDACHGLAPDTGEHDEHDRRYGCETCHNGYIKNTQVNTDLHINGNREVQFTSSVGGSYSNGVCTNVSCHGNRSIEWND